MWHVMRHPSPPRATARRRGALAGIVVLLAAGAACRPNYPRCAKDEQCAEHGEVCINGQCQECRDDAQCAARYPSEARVCRDGRCEPRPECQADVDCAAAGMICRNSKCVPQCAQDTDCGAGHRCVEHRCVGACNQDVDCGPGRSCIAGQCEDGDRSATPIGASCRPTDAASGDVVALEPVRFEFNKYDLSGDARDALAHLVACLKQAPPGLKVIVEGHCDDRGTQEYNLALGEKRAQNVVAFLRTQGVDAGLFSVRSKGENEPLCSTPDDACFAKNRRVQFIQKRGGR